MRDNLVQRRSIDILSKLLAEENITVVHDQNAKTASFYPKERKLVFPTYGDQISTVTQIMLALHETGHATDTPEEVLELMKVYGRSVVNILEDVRIEKIVKNKLAGSIKFFTQGYRELVLNHDFFGTASKENPFDFSHMRFLDRVNVHFKLGAQAMVPFSTAEQKLVDKIAQVVTVADLEALAKELKEIAKENSKNPPVSGPLPEAGDDSEESDDDFDSDGWSDDSDGDEFADDSDDGSDGFGSDDDSDDDSEGSGSDDADDDDSDEDSEGSGSAADRDDQDERDDDEVEIDESEFGTDSTGSSESNENGEESDGEETEGEESESDETDSDEALTGESGDAEDSEESSVENPDTNTEFTDFEPEDNNVALDSDDLDYSETESRSSETLEKLAKAAGAVGSIPKSTEIDGLYQPWKDIESYVDKAVSGTIQVGSWPNYEQVDPYVNLVNFRREVKPLLNKMLSEFNRNAAGTVSRRTSYRDIGVLDPNKMIHYRYNENIFKKRKFVRDGKNHGVCLFIDFTGSMNRRIRPIMRQVVLMVDFCRKLNIPFRVYGWSDCFLPSTSGDFTRDYGKELPKEAIVEVFNNNMPTAVLEKYSAWALSGRGMTPGGSTPLVTSMYRAIPIIHKFRQEAKVDVMKFMFFTDGDGHTSLEDWGADSWIDEQTGTQYSSKELSLRFYHKDYAYNANYSWKDKAHRQISFITDILKDRYNVDSVFVFMNSGAFAKPMLRSGRWSDADQKKAVKELREMKITHLKENDHSSVILLTDGYDILSEKFSLAADLSKATDRVVKTAFIAAGRSRKASTLFASEVAKSLAEAA